MFMNFSSIHKTVEGQIESAHEHKKTYILANYNNIDPNFHHKWHQKMIQVGLKCEICKNMSDSFFDAEMETFADDNDEDLEMIRELKIKESNCAKCSIRWCKFTLDMLNDYAAKTFR